MSRCCFARSLAFDRLPESLAALADFAVALLGVLVDFALAPVDFALALELFVLAPVDFALALEGFALALGDFALALEGFALALTDGLAERLFALADNLVEGLLALDRVFAVRLLVLARGVERLALALLWPVFRAANGLPSAMSHFPPAAGCFTRIVCRSMPWRTA